MGGFTGQLKAKLKDLPEMNYYHTDPNPRGELLLKGNCVFAGYFKNPEKTREVLSEDGWYSTGDVVEVQPNGSMKIIDRAKNIFKLSQGEYIAPEKLQAIYGQVLMISQIFVHGESSQDYLMAIIVPDQELVKKWASQNNLDTDKYEEILQNNDLKAHILDQMRLKAEEFKLNGLEKIRKVHLTSTMFSPENDLVTPTMKIKRFNVKQYFAKEIQELYATN